jgi:CRP-like cAMP-binding protein
LIHRAAEKVRRVTLEQDMRRLSAIPLFAELGPEALRLLAFSGETRIFRTGDVLFRRGEIADGGFILMIGSITLDPMGEGRTAKQIVGPGTLIGERALISALPRPTTAVAREPSTVLKITRRLFYRVLNEFPGSADRVRKNLARDLREKLSGFRVEEQP